MSLLLRFVIDNISSLSNTLGVSSHIGSGINGLVLVLLFGDGSGFTLGLGQSLDLIGVGHLVKILKLILAQAKIKFGQLLNIRV